MVVTKQRIADLIAVGIIVVFLIAIYLLPPLGQAFMSILCYPENAILKLSICPYGSLLFYVVPFLFSCWLVVRLSVKITKFASFVSEDSYVCRGMRSVYEKVKALDG